MHRRFCYLIQEIPSEVIQHSNARGESAHGSNTVRNGTYEAAIVAFFISATWVIIGLLLSQRRDEHLLSKLANNDYRHDVQVQDIQWRHNEADRTTRS
jgi:hypothetical protein